ncbi:MAG: DUF4296 domain-containing protein [Bacteroidales bacterium]|nr:DUF4296 domain-containing protein [Bacteroidales bacterium]
MKRVLLIVCLLALAVSCHKGPRRIPRGDMEDIMMHVLMQDQYVKAHSELRPQFDTMLVYEGVFESFGYNTDDFLASLQYYLEDASRMEKIMEKVEKRLMVKVKEAEIEVQEESWRKDFLNIWSLYPDKRHLPQPSSAYDTLYIQFSKDSLTYHPLRIKK